MKVALLGGAFNPPHLGHLQIAQQVLDFTNTDEVWFLPNYSQNPPKPVAPIADRLAMTQMLKLPRTQVSTIEIDQQLDGQTINLLPHLPAGRQGLPKEYDFKFIIGSDQLAQFYLWGSWKELIKKIPFLIFPRYGYPNEPLYENMTVIAHELLIGSNLSSTKIRERVKKGLPITNFVPPEVEKYIIEHGLYK